MTNFTDIFKNSFMQETGNLTVEGFAMSLLAAFICSMILYFVYRYFFKGVVYNNNFNILIVLTGLITCFIVIVISSNVILSLGMVGALSIVRYRTAVKDPLDVGFLFFAVAIGVTCGAGLYIIGLGGTIFISLIYILLVKVRNRKRVYLFIVKYQNIAAESVLRELKPLRKILKNKTSTNDFTELTYEMKINGDDTSFVTNISKVEGVENAMIVDFTGDYFE